MTVFLLRENIDRDENRNCDILGNNRGRRLEWLNHVIAVSRPILSYARPGLTSNTRSSDVTHLEFLLEACGDFGDVNERGPYRKKRAPREEGRANVPLGPSWCCPPGVAVAVGEEEVVDVVIWNVGQVAVGVFPVLPPSVLLSQEPRGVAAPWWGSPPTKSAKVLRHSITIESGTVWGRGSRGRGRDRGGGANLFGSGVAPANYAPGLQGVAPELREVVNILGERNQAGTLTGVGRPPGTLDNDSTCDDEEGTSTKRPPRPLYRRLINYVRQAWTGVKFALDSEYEEEQTPRYRPDSLASLCRATRFTEAELKRIYRGFKAECPTGVVREDTFKCIYSQFFPQGANTSQYAHYVFNTLDQDHSGLLSFEDFVTGLSILSRGSIDEKLRWTFSLYDINGDGCITREEMTDIVTAVYELMGKFSDPNLDHEGVRQKVDRMFQKMDGNRDGVVTLSEFLEACRADPDISTSMAALDTAF
ncbi:Kv channel-interacting protein 4 [Camponotus floridanus]|uniref:Kv channel-interacting protein 4 n=1 Tax=Camponotus floridanus TaxID=104421 RepID=E2AB85_CAMFO|nr:Kv channel-interacting protein 4 [Camponotus floridanus]